MPRDERTLLALETPFERLRVFLRGAGPPLPPPFAQLPMPPFAPLRDEEMPAPPEPPRPEALLSQPPPFPGAPLPAVGREFTPAEAEAAIRTFGQGPFASQFDRHPVVGKTFRHAVQEADRRILGGLGGVWRDARRPEKGPAEAPTTQGPELPVVSGIASAVRHRGVAGPVAREELPEMVGVKRPGRTRFFG